MVSILTNLIDPEFGKEKSSNGKINGSHASVNGGMKPGVNGFDS